MWQGTEGLPAGGQFLQPQVRRQEGRGQFPRARYLWAGLAVYTAMRGTVTECQSQRRAFCGPGPAPQITHVFLCQGNGHPSEGRCHSSHS